MPASVFSPHCLFNRLAVEDALVQSDYFSCIAVCKVKEEFVDTIPAELRDIVEKTNGKRSAQGWARYSWVLQEEYALLLKRAWGI